MVFSDLRAALVKALSDRYAVEREIGRGGMATVFLARDLKHDRPVALKVLRADMAESMGSERFQREVRLVAGLHHPHILSVFDSGDANGHLWYTMPFVQGESLRDRLQRDRHLPLDEALRIARQVLDALSYAHHQGIVHRDIKPENILLTGGHALLADFGIARGPQGDARAETRQVTALGMAIGTPAYMSPEQATGGAVDARTDIYATGCVLFEMLSGEPPHWAPTPLAILQNRLRGDMPAVRQSNPDVPESAEFAIQKALAPVAEHRWTTATEFATALTPDALPPIPVTISTARAAAAHDRTGASLAATPAERHVARWHLVARAGLAAAAVVVLGSAALGIWRWVRPTPIPSAGRIVVLPFLNRGPSDQDYFVEGMTDEVRGRLGGIPALAVIATASSNQYRHTTKLPRQIGDELGVQYILTGTVRWDKSGDGRVRVTPELTAVETNTVVWQQSFDAVLSDVFAVQGDIATRVALAMDVAIGARERRAVSEKLTTNVGAYDAFLQGEALNRGSDPLSRQQALGFYERAVSLDPKFAVAWARVSAIRSNRYLEQPTSFEARRSREASDRAIALAPDRPHGYRALGLYYARILRDYPKAIAQFEEALRIAPGEVGSLAFIAGYEARLGRWELAREHYQRAALLDPRAPGMAGSLSEFLTRMRRYDEAIGYATQASALNPRSVVFVRQKAQILVAQGDLDNARAVLRTVPSELNRTGLVVNLAASHDLFWVLDDEDQRLLLTLGPDAFGGSRGNWALALAEVLMSRGQAVESRRYATVAREAFQAGMADATDDPQLHTLLGLALAYEGRAAEGVPVAERGTVLMPISKDALTGAQYQHRLVRVYLLANQYERALDRLEELLRQPSLLSPGWLRLDPAFAPLRGHPRFEKLVHE